MQPPEGGYIVAFVVVLLRSRCMVSKDTCTALAMASLCQVLFWVCSAWWGCALAGQSAGHHCRAPAADSRRAGRGLYLQALLPHLHRLHLAAVPFRPLGSAGLLHAHHPGRNLFPAAASACPPLCLLLAGACLAQVGILKIGVSSAIMKFPSNTPIHSLKNPAILSQPLQVLIKAQLAAVVGARWLDDMVIKFDTIVGALGACPLHEDCTVLKPSQ